MQTDTVQLLASIEAIDRIPSQEWDRSLTPRQRAELDFHNMSRTATEAGENFDAHFGNKKSHKGAGRSVVYTYDWIAREAKDRVFLDYCCGNGNQVFVAAEAGAKLAIGFDISDVSVENCRKQARARGLTANTVFFQADAENTKLPSESIDRILCHGVLHHLDLSYAFPELRRILKVGGKVFAADALAYNPAIWLYRMLTPSQRTD